MPGVVPHIQSGGHGTMAIDSLDQQGPRLSRDFVHLWGSRVVSQQQLLSTSSLMVGETKTRVSCDFAILGALPILLSVNY
jgi:hypothetical protein